MHVTWQTIDEPDNYVAQVLAEEAADIPERLINDHPWYCDVLDLTELDVNEEMVAWQDARSAHLARRDGFIDRIRAGQPIPPLIALGSTLHLVDGYARCRALRLLHIGKAQVLRQRHVRTSRPWTTGLSRRPDHLKAHVGGRA